MRFFKQNTRFTPLISVSAAMFCLLFSICVTVAFISGDVFSVLLLLKVWILFGGTCTLCLVCAYITAKQGIYISEGSAYYRRIRMKQIPYTEISAVILIPRSYNTKFGPELSYRRIMRDGHMTKVQVYTMFVVKELTESTIDPKFLGKSSICFYDKYHEYVLGQALYYPDLLQELLRKNPEINIVEDIPTYC